MTQQLDRANILIVDDEVDVGRTFKIGLESKGYSVDVFNDPHEVLLVFKHNSYQTIFLDMKMPGLGGIQLARAIWRKDPCAKICLMATFEIYENEAKMVFKNFKNYCFLKKPLTSEDLIRHIKNHSQKLRRGKATNSVQ